MSDLYLQGAQRIAQRLCRDAFWHGRQCTWLGWAMADLDDDLVQVWRSMGPDLYRGTSGIALFLARLHAVAPDPVLAETIDGALAQALATVGTLPAEQALGLHTGAAGVAYAAVVIGPILGRDDLVDAGLDRLAALPDATPELFDVVSGAAGVIPVLVDAAARYDRPDLLARAVRLGDGLLAAARPAGDGLGWGADLATGRPLCGYSHGAGGVALALAELHAVTGEGRFADGVAGALAYERGLFDRRTGNWPDLRRPNEPVAPASAVAWCHGAPGIGQARLRMCVLAPDDAALRAEVDAALAATVASVRGEQPGLGNHSLCHGAFGNLDLLLDAAVVLGRRDLVAVARAVADHALRTVEAQGLPWLSGNPEARPTPGLMLGDAGVGLSLLRVRDPGVPSATRIGPVHRG